jgi:molybdate transport system substrate-binding protein
MKVLMLIALAALVASTHSARSGELNVWAASSLTDVLKDLAREYEQSADDRVAFNFAGSQLLARQIVQGAPADLFISADEEKMDNLQNAGLIVPESRREIAGNALVVIAPADTTLKILSVQDLASASINRVALADPKAVPAGVYAAEFLRRASVWDSMAGKILPTENVRAATALVASGNADIGIVYKTDVRLSKDLKVLFAVPPEAAPPIRYPAAVVAASTQRDHAEAFLRFLGSERAARIFEHHGFLVQH